MVHVYVAFMIFKPNKNKVKYGLKKKNLLGIWVNVPVLQLLLL